MKQKRRRQHAGSVTVEAALIFSILLFVLADVLLMTEYLSDSIRMTAILAEKALDRAGRDTEKGDDMMRGGFFRLHASRINVKDTGNQVEASCRDIPENSRYGEMFEAVFAVRRRKPVHWIRAVRLLQSLAE